MHYAVCGPYGAKLGKFEQLRFPKFMKYILHYTDERGLRRNMGPTVVLVPDAGKHFTKREWSRC